MGDKDLLCITWARVLFFPSFRRSGSGCTMKTSCGVRIKPFCGKRRKKEWQGLQISATLGADTFSRWAFREDTFLKQNSLPVHRSCWPPLCSLSPLQAAVDQCNGSGQFHNGIPRNRYCESRSQNWAKKAHRWSWHLDGNLGQKRRAWKRRAL